MTAREEIEIFDSIEIRAADRELGEVWIKAVALSKADDFTQAITAGIKDGTGRRIAAERKNWRPVELKAEEAES